MFQFFLSPIVSPSPSLSTSPLISPSIPWPSLPPELIEGIIDEVGLLNDTETLRACSLASSTFVYHAQSHLFRSIDLDRQLPRKKYYQRFHRLLISKPHLGTYVRNLRLGDDAEDEFEYGGRGRSDSSWITHSKTLPQTLELLPRLEGFSLTFNSEMTDWRAIPDKTRSAFEGLFCLPSLQAVSLEFICCFPPRLLISLARLRYLGLSCVEADTSAPPSNYVFDLEPTQASHLRSLFLRGTSTPTIQAISQALAISSPPTLNKLSVTPTFEHGFCDAISDLITTNGSEIKAFEWLPSVHFSSSFGSINIANLPHLRFLRLIITFRRTAHGPFSEVFRLLSQVSSEPNLIETIVLDCHLFGRIAQKANLESLKAEWRPVDNVLSRSGFERLKEVKIELSTNTSTDTDRQTFVLAFQDFLPGVERKGILISVHTRLGKDERFLIEGFGECW